MVNLQKSENNKYVIEPPDGGWGYLVAIASTLTLVFTTTPAITVGLIFGSFLSDSNDEVSTTTALIGMFGAIFHLTGLLTNVLLQKLSFRQVALIGAFLYCSSSFASIFVTNFRFLMISFGTFQAIGSGILLPSAFSAMNVYFNNRKMFVIAIGHTVVGALAMILPVIIESLLNNYGFRGTQAILTALSLNTFFVALVLHPVKWHSKKREISIENSNFTEPPINNDRKFLQGHSFSKIPSQEFESQELLNECVKSGTFSSTSKAFSKSLTSIASFGNAVSYVELRKKKHKNLLCRLLDLSLLNDLNYWILIFALSVSLTTEMNVMGLLPAFLANKNFNRQEITLMITIFFAADLAAKISLTLITAFCKFRNRVAYLINAVLSLVLRIVFTGTYSLWWSGALCALLGFSRSFIHVLNLLIITETYTDKFSSAFSFYMVFTGVFALLLGLLTGFVKNTIGSDSLVLYILAAAQLVCIIPWTIQLLHNFIQKKWKTGNDI